MFGGASEALLMSLVDSLQITAEQIARASALIAREEADEAALVAAPPAFEKGRP